MIASATTTFITRPNHAAAWSPRRSWEAFLWVAMIFSVFVKSHWQRRQMVPRPITGAKLQFGQCVGSFGPAAAAGKDGNSDTEMEGSGSARSSVEVSRGTGAGRAFCGAGARLSRHGSQ